MAIQRTRKQKESPNYSFLYSWQPKPPSQAHVKGESGSKVILKTSQLSASKRADIQAKDAATVRIKKDIIRSLILISFALALEVVVYLAWIKFNLS